MLKHLIKNKILASFLCAITIFTANAEYKTASDISYSSNTDTYSRQRCRLDVYYNDSIVGAPVVVWFHGGGLVGGNRYIPEALKEQGYVVVAPNYRFLTGVGLADCIDDAAAAVAWTFANIGDYGGDTRSIFVSGHSAGGYLTSMVGLQKSWLAKYGVEADSIAGLFPFSGQAVTHFEHRKRNGGSELRPTIDETAPLYHVRPDAPPYIIVSGDREMELFGRYEENAYMWRMMKLVGHPDVRIYELDGYGHVEMAVPAFHIMKQNIGRILRRRDANASGAGSSSL